jgi:hypothetical protein
VFEGPNPFIQFGWDVHTFAVKPEFLKEGDNTLRVANVEESNVRTGPPFFMLCYAIVKAADRP